MPVTLIHLSDLHIKNKHATETENLRCIVEGICDRYGDRVDTTAILITGDLVHDGCPEQFDLVKTLLSPLYQQGFNVWPIPGNHDYGTLGIHAEERRFKYFKTVFYDFEDVSYPQVKEFGNHVLIGLNSMKAETNPLDGLFADGELGQKQLSETIAILGGLRDRPLNKKVILHLHHHPFLYADDGIIKSTYEIVGHRLKDGHKLMRALEGNVDVLLFGHEHRHLNFSYTKLSKTHRIPIVLSAGKSTKISTEYQVREDGRINKARVLHCGLMGRAVEIDDDGAMTTETILFQPAGELCDEQ